MNSIAISVIIPVYKCSSCLNELYMRLKQTLIQISENYEIILINDNSPDNSWQTIQLLAQMDPRVKGISLSRNFGQHCAITAGIDHCSGEWVVVMDCDLQDQPEEILKLYQKAQEGYDVVFGQRQERKDSLLKRFSSYFFYLIFNYLTDATFDRTIGNFSICKKIVADNFKLLREHNRSYHLFLSWMGFATISIDIEHSKRNAGKSSYTLKKLLNFAFDNIIAHSNKPLKISIKAGIFMALISLTIGLILILKKLIWDVPIEGWTSIIVSLFFIGGLIFANIGILGLYINKIFEETKNRPLYIVAKKTESFNNQ